MHWVVVGPVVVVQRACLVVPVVARAVAQAPNSSRGEPEHLGRVALVVVKPMQLGVPVWVVLVV